jgi:hypothetical protein
MMKKLVYLLITLSLIALILLIAGADVNYGYGPGYSPYGYNNSYGYND